MISALNSASQSSVSQSILAASSATGVGFDYLMRTAMRESSLDPSAKARTSSATGLYQFVDQTWLSMIDRHGAKYGLETYSDAVQQASTGRYKVTNPAMKAEILALRYDPEIASLMAGELARENRASLERHLGRPVSDGEVYSAHFLGTNGAISLLKAAQTDPNASAADLLPQAAKANRSIFYAGDGTAHSISTVVQKVTHLPQAELPETIIPTPSVVDMRGTLDAAPAASLEPRQAYAALPSLPLVLSPGVLEILASLNPIPDKMVWGSLFTRGDQR
jgi:hypothetical protein